MGHLCTVAAVRHHLAMHQVLFVPASMPPLRDPPAATPHQRLEMVKIAVQNVAGFELDAREVTRSGPSYTVLTLEELRLEYPGLPLCLILGLDAFQKLPQWHRWRELLGLAHVALMQRPGWQMPEGPLPDWWSRALIDHPEQMSSQPAGHILPVDVPAIDISSTDLRDRLRAGLSVAEHLPEGVQQYIKENRLYGCCG
tara:strand:- start:554 stop:1147 length:594 start_codon:yes stop_codon:yes gene_type:complete